MTVTSPTARPALRFPSVDALRGVVVFTMIYVNDVAGVKGVPWWMKHHDETGLKNGMTFVDWVFGAFLFIVGFSIPLAFRSRLARGESRGKLLLHILTRTAGLLLLGVFMVNGEHGPDESRLGWSRQLWHVLLFASGILAFLATPIASSRIKSRIYLALRITGFTGLAFLAIVFRDKQGQIMQPHWWGILGLIGWAYLVASVGYLILRRREWLACATFILIALFMFDQTGFWDHSFAEKHLPWLTWLSNYINYGEMFGSHGAIAMAGVFLGATLLDPAIQSHKERIGIAITWGIFLLIAATLVYPVYGINKNDATPSWSLICAAATCFVWAILSLLIDVAGIQRPLALFINGGQNVLFAYLIMPLFIHTIWWLGLSFYGKIGHYSLAAGITRSLVMSALVLWIAGFVKEKGVRLKL